MLTPYWKNNVLYETSIGRSEFTKVDRRRNDLCLKFAHKSTQSERDKKQKVCSPKNEVPCYGS